MCAQEAWYLHKFVKDANVKEPIDDMQLKGYTHKKNVSTKHLTEDSDVTAGEMTGSFAYLVMVTQVILLALKIAKLLTLHGEYTQLSVKILDAQSRKLPILTSRLPLMMVPVNFHVKMDLKRLLFEMILRPLLAMPYWKFDSTQMNHAQLKFLLTCPLELFITKAIQEIFPLRLIIQIILIIELGSKAVMPIQ